MSRFRQRRAALVAALLAAYVLPGSSPAVAESWLDTYLVLIGSWLQRAAGAASADAI